jgi:DHA2 family multidrug resistance protein
VVNLRVFRSRGFSFGVLALSLCFGTYFASIVVIPQWLQMSMGYTATQAGIVTGFTAMSALTTSAIAARLVGKVDARIMVSCAMTWLGIMALWRTTHWTADADFWTLALPQMVQGVAMPFFIVPLTTITLGAVPPSEVPSAAGLQNFLRTMASAVAASIVLTLWETSQRVSHSEIVSSLNPDDTLRTLSNTGFAQDQAWQVIANLADQQATAQAVNHVFLLSTGALFLAAMIVWLSPRPKGPVAAPGGH